MYLGLGQYSPDTGLNTPLDTSGVQIVPTFVGPCPVAGQLMNPQTGACVTATSPTAYIDPSLATSTTGGGLGLSNVYLIIGAVVAFALILGGKK